MRLVRGVRPAAWSGCRRGCRSRRRVERRSRVDVSAGSGVACALRASGRVACWGDNTRGAVGVPAQGDESCDPQAARCRPEPVEVANLADVTQISVGHELACALRKDGKVLCWGANEHATLGDGTTTPSSRFDAVEVEGLPRAVEVVAGGTTACARVTENGGVRVYCWGSSEYAEIGQPAAYKRLPPTLVPGLDGAKRVRLGVTYAGAACAILADDTVACWGGNIRGVLGHASVDGGSGGDQARCGLFAIPCNPSPSLVGGGGFTADDLVVGQHFACVRTGGAVQCWGSNHSGGLGRGGADVDDHPDPAPVVGLSGVTAISARRGHVCAIAAGQLTCWGSNGGGELANGFAGDPCVFGPLTSERCNGVPGRASGLTGVTLVSAGDSFTTAIASGELYAWGTNNEGQLGHPRSTNDDQVAGCGGLGAQVCNGAAKPVVLP